MIFEKGLGERMSKCFLNKTVLITGGGRGIGATTARLFVEEGAEVIITSRTIRELEKVRASVSKKDKIYIFPSDVSQEKKVGRLFKMIQKKFKKLDVLINNAAAIQAKEFSQLTTQDWNRVMDVNVRGAFLCSQAAFQMMKKQKQGCIVNVSSLAGLIGVEKFVGFSSYIVSKFALVGLTESLAAEGRPWNIRVNAVAPGAVQTKMLKEAAPFLKTKTYPADIARVIAFLCGEPCLNGTVIPIYSNL